MDTESNFAPLNPLDSALQASTLDPALAAGRATWNARQPMNKLPLQVLVEILLYCGVCYDFRIKREDPDRFLHAPQWFRLRLVCRHWRAVVDANPHFWRDIFVGKNTQWLDLAISRSQNLGLRFCFCHGTAIPASIDSVLMEYTGRIECLRGSCFRTSQDRGLLLHLLALALPSLISVDLTILYHYGEEITPCELHPEQYPRLVNVSLSEASFPWTTASVLFIHLRSLRLYKCSITPSSIAFNDFLDILHRAEQLEELSLTDVMSTSCSYSGHIRDDPTSLQVVSLPRGLRDLSLTDTPLWLSRFLSQVELPTEGRISVSVFPKPDLDEYSCLAQYASFLLTDPCLSRLPFLFTATKVKLCAGSSSWPTWGISCEAPGPLSFTFYLMCLSNADRRITYNSEEQALSYLPHLFRAAPVEELDLTMDLPWIEHTIILDNLMRAIPHIRRLKIGSAHPGSRLSYPTQFFDTLYPRNNRPASRYRESDPAGLPGSLRWPYLKSIHIEGFEWCNGYFLPLLIQSLAQRAECGAPKLDTLVLKFSRYDYPQQEWDFADVVFRCAFSMYVDNCIYTVHPLSHKY
ncbi:hypothetical protein FKP32DRAFT_1597599 [Trametes sanguinea]|nr:hypothetical protein FKP32DRAFT_1597599 [Trametes sanguinea]